MDLTTLAEVKDFLAANEVSWDNNFDYLINSLIKAASRQFDTYCNRGFELKERTEIHSGGGRYLFLQCPPIAVIKSIKASYNYEWEEGSEVDDYAVVNPDAGIVAHKSGQWSYGVDGLQVIYTGGLVSLSEDEPPVLLLPDDLKIAATMQVAYTFRRRKDIGLESVSFPDGSIQKMAKDLLPEVKAILNPYRLRPMG